MLEDAPSPLVVKGQAMAVSSESGQMGTIAEMALGEDREAI